MAASAMNQHDPKTTFTAETAEFAEDFLSNSLGDLHATKAGNNKRGRTPFSSLTFSVVSATSAVNVIGYPGTCIRC